MLETISWIIGVDLGLASIAAIFAAAWVRVVRIDKIEKELEGLRALPGRIDVLNEKLESIEKSLDETKEILKERINVQG